jgi:hypothetical protein
MTLQEINGGRAVEGRDPPAGRKPLSARRIKQVVDLTLHEKPPNATHWSVRIGWTSRRAHVKALRGARGRWPQSRGS